MERLKLNLMALNADENTSKIQGKINEIISAIEKFEKREQESCNLADVNNFVCPKCQDKGYVRDVNDTCLACECITKANDC